VGYVPANEKILLDAIIDKRKADQAAEIDDADFFEIFTAENILKQEALTYEELESGIVGAGGDGGLDAVFFLADGRLVREDTQADDFKKRPTFEAYFIQAKRTEGFNEKAIDKFVSVTENLFDLSKKTSDFEELYNADVRRIFDDFRRLYIALAGLLKSGLYYDRQKNFYKNEGRPLGRIIGIAEMAQTVMAALLQRPNDARARPSSLIKDDEEYERIFSEKFPIQLYVACGELKKRSDDALRKLAGLESGHRNNVLYYVITRLACRLTGKAAPDADAVAAIKADQVTPEAIKLAYDDVWALYEALGADEKVAKGRDLVARVKELPVEETAEA
jgi:hypothetical protein